MSDTHTTSDPMQSLTWIADEMRSMAAMSHRFAGNIYELERADRMMELAAKIMALAGDTPAADLARSFKQEFDSASVLHVSPVIGVEAVVINAAGEILLIQRKDNAHWAMPGGFAEIGRTISESALLELWEEAGLRGRVERLLGIFDGRTWGSRFPGHIIAMDYLVTCDDLTPKPGIETLDAGFFARDALPTPLHPGHELRIPQVFDVLEQGILAAYHDPADSRGITMPMHQRRNGA